MQDYEQYPDSPGARDRALLLHTNPSYAARLAEAAKSSEFFRESRAASERMMAFNLPLTLHTAWRAEMLDETTQAEAYFQAAAQQGLPVKFVLGANSRDLSILFWVQNDQGRSVVRCCGVERRFTSAPNCSTKSAPYRSTTLPPLPSRYS